MKTKQQTLTKIDTLDLDNSQLTAEHLNKILSMIPEKNNIRELLLANNEIGPDGAKHIANSTNLKNLEMLDLAGNNIDDVGAGYLANSTNLKNLEQLDLSFNNIDPSMKENLSKILNARSEDYISF